MTLWPDDLTSHFAICHRLGDDIAVGVRIFDTFTGNVFVSHQASAYSLGDQLENGEFLRNDTVGGSTTRSSLLDEFARLASEVRQALT